MALKLRLENAWQFDGGDDERATLFVEVVVFDDANSRVVDRRTLTYDLAAFEAEHPTNAGKVARLRADAEAFGAAVRGTSVITQRIAAMVGTVIDIPT